MSIVVLKFGGTSVSTLSRLEKMKGLLSQRLQEGHLPLVVISAFKGVSNILEKLPDIFLAKQKTNLLDDLWNIHQDMAKQTQTSTSNLTEHMDNLKNMLRGIELTQEAPPRLRAQILSLGEVFSTEIVGQFLKKDLPLELFQAKDWLKVDTSPLSSEHYLSSSCDFQEDQNFISFLKPGHVYLTQGFVASNNKDEICLLGRGGSDSSASYFAAKAKAQRVEIWTDVPGMFTANPHSIPEARLLKKLNYDEAQEMASLGALVLHPPCLLPVRQKSIPMIIGQTDHPEKEGTTISSETDPTQQVVKCICKKSSVPLISLENVQMWHQPGYLAKVFDIFREYHLSIDLFSTSQTSITFSLDGAAGLLDQEHTQVALSHCQKLGKLTIHPNCAALSLVGQQIRQTLPQISKIFEAFEDKKLYLIGQAANDLNMTFVVDNAEVDKLEKELHGLLFSDVKHPSLFGATLDPGPSDGMETWWVDQKKQLQELANKAPHYVLHAPTVKKRTTELLNMKSLSKVFYAIKANAHPQLLKTLAADNIGLECVSWAEVELASQVSSKDNILFTPNFAPFLEYQKAKEAGILTTIDGLYILENWGEQLSGMDILLRFDPGEGKGHHKHVKTAGDGSKFGLSTSYLSKIVSLVEKHKFNVKGLHVHAGSFIPTPSHWVEMATFLHELSAHFPSATIFNLGGGLPVPMKPGAPRFDLTKLDEGLLALKKKYPSMNLWMEPGRYIVAEAGALVALATQYKTKGHKNYLGLNVGMNALIRPGLYGSYHHIVNLNAKTGGEVPCDIVGPICESGDTLGHHRQMSVPTEGDCFVIACTGAYGRVMSSSYNKREIPEEVWLD